MSEISEKWEKRLKEWPNWKLEIVIFVFGILAWLALNLVARPLSYLIKVIAVFTQSPSAWLAYEDSQERLREFVEDRESEDL